MSFRKIIQFILKKKAKKVIRRFNPLVIGITGSVGKSSTKEMIALALSSKFSRLRQSPSNYNNEVGLPLTILNEKGQENNLGKWLSLFWRTRGRALRRMKEYPEILVLEMAADHPGDISYLLSIVKPKIGILTAIAPCHLEYFKNIENVKREKIKLLTSISEDGWAIFNSDDPNLSDIKQKIKAKIITFGFNPSSDIYPLEIQLDQELKGKRIHILGLRFKIKCQGNVIPVFLPKVLSGSLVNSVLATMAVGVTQEINLLKIAEKIRQYKPLSQRMNLIYGKNGTLIIDDTYNSSPYSLKSALSDLDQIKNHPQTQKWVVLSDMLELGVEGKKYHLKIGQEIARKKDCRLVATGDLSLYFVKGAREEGTSKERALYFKEKQQAIEYLLKNIKEGDVILVKGSRATKMEEVVEKLKK